MTTPNSCSIDAELKSYGTTQEQGQIGKKSLLTANNRLEIQLDFL